MDLHLAHRHAQWSVQPQVRNSRSERAPLLQASGARPRAAAYGKLLKEGDLLLHRLQQLSKIVDVE